MSCHLQIRGSQREGDNPALSWKLLQHRQVAEYEKEACALRRSALRERDIKPLMY